MSDDHTGSDSVENAIMHFRVNDGRMAFTVINNRSLLHHFLVNQLFYFCDDMPLIHSVKDPYERRASMDNGVSYDTSSSAFAA